MIELGDGCRFFKPIEFVLHPSLFITHWEGSLPSPFEFRVWRIDSNSFDLFWNLFLDFLL